jgi:hypothetical protein
MQVIIWYSSNGQFLSKTIKENSVLVASSGILVSWLAIKFTEIGYGYFYKLWPLKLMAFAVGTIIFAILTRIHMNEDMTLNTHICLVLATVILILQFK